LAASIRELGILQPVLVRQIGGDAADDFELIAGERRWRAARRAGLQTIPVLLQTSSETLSLEQALVENLHRQDLNVLEEAAAYQQLIEEFGHTHDQVATRVGRSRAGVSNTLRLLQLPAGAQRLLAEGQISPGHARALLGTPDRGYQETLAKRTATEGLTVRTVEDLIRQHDERAKGDDPIDDGARPADRPSDRRLPPPGILELEELLSSHLNTRVKIDLTSKRGKVVVEFATLEDLERIYTLMVGRAGAETA
jgi:ParB family chromosome partitioning protein